MPIREDLPRNKKHFFWVALAIWLGILAASLLISKISAIQAGIIFCAEKVLGRKLSHPHWHSVLSHTSITVLSLTGKCTFWIFVCAAALSYIRRERSWTVLCPLAAAGAALFWIGYTGLSFAGLIIPLMLMLLFLFVYTKKHSITESLLMTGIIYAAGVVLINNILSLCSGLTSAALLAAYSAISLLLMVLLRKNGCTAHALRREICGKICAAYNRNKILATITMLFCLVSFLAALFCDYRNSDSLSYHSVRIAEWARQHSVNYYFTPASIQLTAPVLAEYIALHSYILFKSDALMNLVQHAAYCASALTIFTICKKMLVHENLCYTGALLFMTMPIAFAESMTTQVDLTGTFLVLAFFYYMLQLLQYQTIAFAVPYAQTFVLAAACFGLGYLAKPSACVPMSLLLLFFALKSIRKRSMRAPVYCAYVMLSAAVFALLVSDTFIRNAWYGHIDTKELSTEILIGTISPKLVAMNFLKNVSQLLKFSQEEFLEEACLHIAGLLHVDINDPRITFCDDFYLLRSYLMDNANAPFVTFLALLLFPVFVVLACRKKAPQRGYTAVVFAAAFSIPLILRWQPWGTRLELPSICLLCVFIPAVINALPSEAFKKSMTVLIGSAIIIFFVPQIQFHDLKIERGLGIARARFLEKDNMPEAIFNGVMWHIKKSGLHIQSAGISTTGRTEIYQLLYRFNKAGIPACQIPGQDNGDALRTKLRNQGAWGRYFRHTINSPDIIVQVGIGISPPTELVYQDERYVAYHGEQFPTDMSTKSYIFIKESLLP